MAGPSAGNATILVVDDEAEVRSIIVRLLRRFGHEVLEAANGEDGLSALGEAPTAVGLVILDLTLPRVSGSDCLATIRTRFPALPVILTSGYTQESAAPVGRDPHTMFLAKPFSLDELKAAVASALGGS